MNHTGSRYLETNRLILRKLTITDADSMFDNWAKDEAVTRYIGWNAHTSIEETREFLQSCIHAYLKPDTYNWAIVEKDSHTLIGTIGTSHQSDVNRSTEIGYIIGSRWWNQGYATEALSCVLPYLLKEVGFDLVEARCFQQNQALPQPLLLRRVQQQFCQI